MKRKVVLIVIDGLTPALFESAVEARRTPALFDSSNARRIASGQHFHGRIRRDDLRRAAVLARP